MQTIPTLFGLDGTILWIAGFTLLHAVTALLFAATLGPIARAGILTGLLLLAAANLAIMKGKTPEAGLKVLPLFHVTMLVYAVSIAIDAVL